MTDWIEHDGGPQPVADDVWVVAYATNPPLRDVSVQCGGPASIMDWSAVVEYRILNQHLIDAARLEGIRLGLEAAAKEAFEWHDHYHSQHIAVAEAIRALDPETIAKEAGRER